MKGIDLFIKIASVPKWYEKHGISRQHAYILKRKAMCGRLTPQMEAILNAEGYIKLVTWCKKK